MIVADAVGVELAVGVDEGAVVELGDGVPVEVPVGTEDAVGLTVGVAEASVVEVLDDVAVELTVTEGVGVGVAHGGR